MLRNLSVLVITITCPLSLCAESITIYAQENSKPKNHSGLLGVYSFTHDQKDGLLNGTSRTGSADVLYPNSNYTLAPERLSTSAHIFGLAYLSGNDGLFFSILVPYVSNEMDVRNNDIGINRTYTTESSGLGDVSVVGMFDIFNSSREASALVGFDLSLPTGSIDQEADTPIASSTPLPFDMQLGTGSFALTPLFMFTGRSEILDAGVNLGSRFHLNRNDNGYKYGDNYFAGLWGEVHVTEWFDVKLGFDFKITESIDGRDSRITTTTDISSDPGKTGGRCLDAKLSVSLFSLCEAAFSLPVYQDLNGPQLEKQWSASLSVMIPLYVN